MLFSATATKKTDELTKLALKKEPMYVGVDDSKEVATVDGLEQGKTDKGIFFLRNQQNFFGLFQATLSVPLTSDSYFCLHF